MNAKQAKERRRAAEQAMSHYARTTVLSEEMIEEARERGILLRDALPKIAYYKQRRQARHGIGSQRWFTKLYKKHTDYVGYEYTTHLPRM